MGGEPGAVGVAGLAQQLHVAPLGGAEARPLAAPVPLERLGGAPCTALQRRPVCAFQRLHLGHSGGHVHGRPYAFGQRQPAAERAVQQRGVAGLARQGHRALGGGVGLLPAEGVVAAAHRHGVPEARARGHVGLLVDLGSQLAQRRARLGVQPRQGPEGTGGGAQADGQRLVALATQRPADGAAQVGQLGQQGAMPGQGGRVPVAGVGGLEERNHGLGMAAPRCGGLAGVFQAFQRELARHLQQPEAPAVTLRQHLHERLRDQALQVVEHLPVVEPVAGRHRLRRRQVEAAREHRQAAEHGLLRVVEQRVAPLQRGTQRLLARRGVACAAGQQRQGGVQALQHAGHAQQRHPRRGQLQRQRYAVEPPAHLRQRGGLGRAGRVAGIGGLHARHQQRRGRAGGHGGGCVLVWHGQAFDAQHMLGGQAQRLLARHQQGHAGGTGEHGSGEFGHGVAQVLGVVQHQQQFQRAQRSDDRRRAAARRQRQRTRHGGRQHARVGDRRQFDHRVAIGQPALCRRPQRQPRLADAAGAHQAEQALRLEAGL